MKSLVKESRKVSVSERLQTLRRLLENEEAGTQDEIRTALEDLDFEVNQSTISRDLKKLGAVKMIDASGRTVYRLAANIAEEQLAQRPPTGLSDMVLRVLSNGSLIVVNTTPGSASLVARFLDQFREDGILGTIAGDDTIFVAPENSKSIDKLLKRISKSLLNS